MECVAILFFLTVGSPSCVNYQIVLSGGGHSVNVNDFVID